MTHNGKDAMRHEKGVGPLRRKALNVKIRTNQSACTFLTYVVPGVLLVGPRVLRIEHEGSASGNIKRASDD
jgi:hypothetical protein